MSTWSPAQYEHFKSERAQPFVDLLALVRRAGVARVVDLGCGTGELTRQLHDALQAQSTEGIDSSETMLARSAAFKTGGLTFRRETIEGFEPARPYDLIFSNAAFHWVEDHPALFARLSKACAQLAVQMPANFDHPSHQVARELAEEAPFAEHAREGPRSGVLAPEQYAQLLHDGGFNEQHVRLQVYAHVLPSPADVVEWVKGSLLTDYQRRLPAPLFDSFVARYREVLLSRLSKDQPYLFTFKRLLLWGAKR
ncbi:MAG: methyltransferase domain-containing protein [Myxococcaceae bacterium]